MNYFKPLRELWDASKLRKRFRLLPITRTCFAKEAPKARNLL
jgi:hypothetical protein